MASVAIIGAGVTGITTAYALLKRGIDVTVFERHRYPAMETSFANGGQLSASNAEVWNRPATILHGLQWMFRRNAPLLFNPKPSWHKYSWIAEFIAQVRNYEKNTMETVRLALEARQHLFKWAEAEQIKFDRETRGILHLYRTKAEFEAARTSNELLKRAGLERHPVNPREMKLIEPAVTGVFHGGFFTPGDATGDIHKFTRGLAAANVRMGGKVSFNTAVESVTARPDRVEISCTDEAQPGGHCESEVSVFDAVMICAGVESRRLAWTLGDRLNIYPVKGYSITVFLDSQESSNAAPKVSLLDDHRKIVTSRLGDRFRVAGTAEFNGFNRDIRADRIDPLVQWTREHFPNVQTDRVVPWSGLRPMTPSMLPRVGRGKRDRVFYNTGHGHLGWTLSAATAELIAEEVAVRFS
jgi:D-amino-acid dehydrogenase